MKKIFFATTLCILFIANSNAQIKNGYYNIQLIASNGYLNYNDVLNGSITIKGACTTNNCNSQVWLIKKRTAGGKTCFTIESPIDHKFLTWANNSSESPNGANIVAKNDREISDPLTKTFLLENKDGAESDGGMFKIQPNFAGATGNYYYMGQAWANNAVHAASDNFYASIDNKNTATNGPNASRDDNILWMITPAKPKLNPTMVTNHDLGIQQSGTAVPLVSKNNVEVDIKTGSDNLEPKSTQHNAEMRIILNGRADVIKQNINEGREWPNNSVHRITLSLPADITLADIKELHLYRKQDGLTYVWQLGERDNWNIDRVTVNANIYTNGVKKRTLLLETGAYRPRVPGANNQTIPLFRFVYEGGDGVAEGQFFKRALSENVATATPPQSPSSGNASLLIIFGTGGDNLEGGNDNNVNVTIRFNSGHRDIVWQNVNNRQSLANYSEANFRKVLPGTADIDLNDIKEIELRHTGGGGAFADNWDLDKIKIIIAKDGIEKILIDKVDAPVHRFTGDRRNIKWAPLH